MENISKIKTEIYRELVEKMIDGGECSDEELYELIEERVFEKAIVHTYHRIIRKYLSEEFLIQYAEWMYFRNL